MNESPPTHPTLLLRLAESPDDASWQRFVDIYAPIVFHFARGRGLQDSDAADVVQEVLVRVAEAFQRRKYDQSRGMGGRQRSGREPMNETLVCPADNELEHLLQDASDSGEPSLVAHLEQCAACQRRIEQMASRGQTWSALANRLRAGQADAGTRPEALDEAMRRLKQHAPWGESAGRPTSPDLPPGLLAPPKQSGHLGCLADYEVLEEVGRGAMGIVLRAFDPNLHRVVAIKVMSPPLAAFSLARQRFVREGHSVAAVCHENVVAVHAVGEAAGVPYLVMQYVAGKTLQERLDQTGPMSVEDILRIGMQAAAGLAAAHAQGLVHRDIKPANLLLENGDGVLRICLGDGGVRPTSFETAEQSKHALYVLSRDRETTSSGEPKDDCP